MLKHLFMLGSLLSLMACSGGEESKPAPVSLIPTELKMNLKPQMMSAKPIDPKFKAKIIKIIGEDRAAVPAMDLVFNRYEDQAGKARALNKLSNEGRSFLEQIKKDCVLSPGETKRSGEVGVGGKLGLLLESTVGGPKCLVDYSSKSQVEISITGLNNEARVYSGTQKSTYETSMKIVGQAMKEKTATHSDKLSSKSESILESIGRENGKLVTGAIYSTGTMDMEKTLADGEVMHGKVIFEIIAHPNQKKAQILMVMTFPEGELRIGITKNADKVECLVNGEASTEEALRLDYGVEVSDLFAD